MTHIENARGETGALKAGRRFTSKDSRKSRTLQGSRRWEGEIIQVNALGPRPVGELLDEIAAATGRADVVADRVSAYARLDPETVRKVDGDRFPPNVLRVVR